MSLAVSPAEMSLLPEIAKEFCNFWLWAQKPDVAKRLLGPNGS